MANKLRSLAERIQAELSELDQVVGRVNEAWQRAQRNADDYYPYKNDRPANDKCQLTSR